MAAATYSVMTAADLEKIGKKIQGPLLKGFTDLCEERQWHDKLKKFKLAASLREVIAPITITRNRGQGASIPAGGSEAKPITTAPSEVSFAFIHRNHRYTFDRTSELVNSADSRAEVFSRMKFQASAMREAMCEHFAFATYGYSSAVICKTSTNATQASGTYTLKDLYGETDLDTASALAQPFGVGSRVALRRSGSLVTNAIGAVTAVDDALGTIAVTWNGSVDSDDGDEVLFANSLENTTLAGGTDHNKFPIGLLDFSNTASIHGLSSATAPLWAPALVDSSGGRFGFVKWRRAANEIKNKGGGTPDLLIMNQAVEADMTDNLMGAVRYNSPTNMTLDGATVIKGVDIVGTRWTPDRRAWLLDSSDLKLWEPAGQMPDASGLMPESSNKLVITDKLENISGKVTGVDYLYARILQNRGNMAYFSGLTAAY
jgi:hypothetical protein